MLHVPRLLRPRWTWSYAAFSSIVLYISYCILVGTPFFSSNLPPYKGKYGVGTMDIEVPWKTRQTSDVVFKDNGLPAFKIETVLFSVFYPTVNGIMSSKPHHTWIPRPISLTGEGYARLAKINNFFANNLFTLALWTLVGDRKIPAQVDIPLYVRYENPPVFPVVIFSHGFATGRTAYTQYLGELASRGYIVVAVEHRDGSCPGSMIIHDDGSKKPVYHFTKSHVLEEGQIDSAAFKQLQFDYREAEMEETYQVLKAINEGRGEEVYRSNSRHEGSSLDQWKGRLDLNSLIVAGHSFGATLALRILKGAPSERFPAKGAIILDPGKHSGPLNTDVNVPTLVIHSASWSKKLTIFSGHPHFEVVKELVQDVIKRGKDAWFVTSVATSHVSVADAPLIEPMLLSWTTGSTIEVKEGVMQYAKVSLDFLEYLRTGRKGGILGEETTHPEYGVDTRTEERKTEMPAEITKYWQIHVAPNER